MTYMKPEIEIEKFDLVEEITKDEESVIGTASVDTKTEGNSAVIVDESVASDLIVG